MFYVKEVIALIVFIPVCIFVGVAIMVNALLVAIREVHE